MQDNFPGFLGYGGIIAIHANWPMYPAGIGWEIALKTLGNYPKGTEFFEIDDIDRCKLLINRDPSALDDPFDSKHYQIAIWHEDLVELANRGFVSGVIEKTDFEFELYQFEKLKASFGPNVSLDDKGNLILHIRDEHGNLKESIYQKPVNNEEDEDFPYYDCVVIPKTIQITEMGLSALSEFARKSEIRHDLASLTRPLIEIQRLDTAIREASLFVETSIKEFHNRPDLFGQKLVNFHIQDIIQHNNGFNSAAIKCYRGELRTIFKFIRNDFAHNFKVVSVDQCKLILQRINDILCEFNEVIKAYYKEENDN